MDIIEVFYLLFFTVLTFLIITNWKAYKVLCQRLIISFRLPIRHKESGSILPGDPPQWPSHFMCPNFFGQEMSQRYGKVYRIWHWATPVVVLADATAVKTFYKDHFSHLRDPDFTCAGSVFKDLLGVSLGVTHGRDKVKQYRAHFEPYFTAASVYNLLPFTVKAVNEWLDTLPTGQPVDLFRCHMTDIPFKVLTVMTYGEEAMTKHVKDIRKLFTDHNEALAHTNSFLLQLPFSKYLPLRANRAVCHFNDTWRDFHLQLLEERREGVISKTDGLFFNLYDNLKAGSVNLDFKQVLQTIDEILLLNVDISYAAASFILYDVARLPDVQEKLFKELEETIDCADISQLEDFAVQLPYLTKVMKESARLHPALGITFPEKTVQQNTEFCGYEVPKGTTVCIDPFSINNDPQYWKDPSTFDPERFSSDRSILPSSYFRFGLGPRKCLGYRMANNLISAMVASLLVRFEVSLANKDDKPTVKSNGMPFFTPYLIPELVFTPRTDR